MQTPFVRGAGAPKGELSRFLRYAPPRRDRANSTRTLIRRTGYFLLGTSRYRRALTVAACTAAMPASTPRISGCREPVSQFRSRAPIRNKPTARRPTLSPRYCQRLDLRSSAKRRGGRMQATRPTSRMSGKLRVVHGLYGPDEALDPGTGGVDTEFQTSTSPQRGRCGRRLLVGRRQPRIQTP